MNVKLLSYNPDALDLLVMTKQTRLSFDTAALEEVRAWPMERKLRELNYMLGTIESSWEFASYTFLITGVSRAFTHQFVRSREGSYAQQSQRTVDMSGFDYITPAGLTALPEGVGGELLLERTGDSNWEPYNKEHELYHAAMQDIETHYATLIEHGVAPQDARGILPTNVATSIIGKFNLRSLSHMAALRLCTRTQGEYQEVFRAMRERVVEVHAWAEPFLRVHCARHGVCAFPHFKECPIKGMVFNPDSGRRWDEAPGDPATRVVIQEAWEETRFEAKPLGAPRSHENLPPGDSPAIDGLDGSYPPTAARGGQ